jgi:hypothetical protein
MNKSKSIDSLNFISTISNANNTTNNSTSVSFTKTRKMTIDSIKNDLKSASKKLLANTSNNTTFNTSAITTSTNDSSTLSSSSSSSPTSPDHHISIIEIVKLNKNQSFESYLIQMHKFFKEKKIYIDPNETYKRRTVVLIRPPVTSSSMTSSQISTTKLGYLYLQSFKSCLYY